MQYWSEPQIYPKNPTKDDMRLQWRVQFNYFNESKNNWQTFALKKGINRYKEYPERLACVNDLKQAVHLKLQHGWNPISNTYPQLTPDEVNLQKLQTFTFGEALDFAYSRKKPQWKHKTGQDYSSVVKYLKLAAALAGLGRLKVKDLKRPHYKLILEHVKTLRKLSAKGYNKYREYLSSLLRELIQWDVVDANFIRDLDPLPLPKKKNTAHKPPTQDERVLIIDRIKTQHRDYYRFLAVLYGCTIRPKEITRLRIKHLHKMEGVFAMPAEITKTNTESEVPVPNWVMDLLSELKLHHYPADYFIFSGKGNMFRPGKNQMSPNVSTYTWKKIVKEGLGLNVNQYGIKKLSGDDMVKLQRREGITNLLELPKAMMRHADEKQTEDYVSEHLNVMKTIIQHKMPQL